MSPDWMPIYMLVCGLIGGGLLGASWMRFACQRAYGRDREAIRQEHALIDLEREEMEADRKSMRAFMSDWNHLISRVQHAHNHHGDSQGFRGGSSPNGVRREVTQIVDPGIHGRH